MVACCLLVSQDAFEALAEGCARARILSQAATHACLVGYDPRGDREAVYVSHTVVALYVCM